jgi:hypothetical protein
MSLHPVTLAAASAINTSEYANARYFANATAKYKGPLSYSPCFGLDFLQLQIGSQTYTFRQ